VRYRACRRRAAGGRPRRAVCHLAIAIAAGLLAGAAPPPVVVPTADPKVALGLVDAAIAENRLESAREIIARASLQSDSPELRLRSAEIALASGALAEAATGFDELRSDAGVAARANQGLGIVRLRQGQLDTAVAALDAALAGDPTLVRAWTARGVAADRQRDFTRADDAYGHALAIDPHNPVALTNRRYSLILRGRYAAAEADLAQAVAAAPALTTAQTDLRFARAMQGRYREAFTGANRARLATDLNTVGFAAMARGDLATAETYFSRAMKINPRFDHVAWANLRYLKGLRDPLGSDIGTDPDSDGNDPGQPR